MNKIREILLYQQLVRPFLTTYKVDEMSQQSKVILGSANYKSVPNRLQLRQGWDTRNLHLTETA